MDTSTSNTAPRRVMYLENGIGYGGAAICLRHLVRNLDPQRYEALVVTGRDGPNYREIANEAKWQHIADRHLDVVGARRKLDAARWPDRLPGLRWLAGQVLARSDDLFNFLPFFFGLLWSALRYRPHLIHANNDTLCNRAILLVGRLLRIPSIAHIRGEAKGTPMLAATFKLPNYFVCVSNWISDDIGRHGVPQQKREVVYDGIALDDMNTEADGDKFRKTHGIPESAFAVGLVGLIIPWKGQELFLDAAARLLPKYPDIYMLMVGGTPDDCRPFEKELRERVGRESWGNRIRFTGHLNGMSEAYNGLDVPVSASTSPEPLGTMVIETMAMGRPLIAPNHGGGAEMNEHEKTALLFEPRNADSLAECIERLYLDRELGRRLGEAARAKALATFDVHTHAERIQAVYDRLLTGEIG
ncbi:MAG: glycosyltransferase family 4 protein [Chromatiales bacterium]|nr:glycosyltransferase family 4 protein [Chromatiales bacterium]